MSFADRGQELFLQGYNCSQSVAGAFCKVVEMPLETMLKMAAPFGGGFGRLREVCGACSGMMIITGLLYGYSTPEEGEQKGKHYALVRELLDKFKEQNRSIICREILNFRAEERGNPTERTPEFYKSRPCVRCVRDACDILEAYINNNK